MFDLAGSAVNLKAKYDEVTCRVVEVLKEAGPVTIIRFGSAAWGTLHEDSDLDLCVVVERTDERPIRHIELSLDRLLWDRYRPRDVEIQLHVYYRDTFEDYLRREDPFLHEVVKGEIVYEASQEAHEWLKESDAAYGVSRFVELAQVRLQVAAQDLAHAKSACELRFFAHACFSCQQAVEKVLKAYLFARRQSLIRTHDLVSLLDHCKLFDDSLGKLSEACTTLKRYYTDTRYPDTLRLGTALTSEEADAALAYAEAVLSFLSPRIEELLKKETE